MEQIVCWCYQVITHGTGTFSSVTLNRWREKGGKIVVIRRQQTWRVFKQAAALQHSLAWVRNYLKVVWVLLSLPYLSPREMGASVKA